MPGSKAGSGRDGAASSRPSGAGGSRATSGLRQIRAAAAAVALRPGLWPVALAQARRFAPRGWWRRPPFLPVPDRNLVRFRAVTMYGRPDAPVEPDDLVRWLRWCRAESRRRRARSAPPPTPGPCG